MFETYISQIESYLEQAWRQIKSWELLGTRSEWFIGIFAGIIGGGITFILVSRMIPKLRISDHIVLNEHGMGRIKVINKRRRWWIWRGDARGLKAEMDFVTYDAKDETDKTKEIPVSPAELTHLQHRRFIRKSRQNDYIFHIPASYHIALVVAERKFDYMRFRITARDSFSNYEGVYEKRYYREGSRHAKRGYRPLIVGRFRGSGDVRIRTNGGE